MRKEESKECLNLDELKEEYKKFRSKYQLPEFRELNKFFDIEDIDVETDFLLRKIRRVIADRIGGYLRFIETILNPCNAPMFFFKLLKKLDNTDKDALTRVYETMGNFEIQLVSLDLDYNEGKEVEFIKAIYKEFNENSRLKLLNVVNKLSNGESKKRESSGSYFG